MEITSSPERKALREIFEAAVDAANPYSRVREHGDPIKKSLLKGEYKSLIVVGFGKASVLMARAAEEELGEFLREGAVITKYGHTREKLKKVRLFEAGHPIPDENGVKGTAKIIELIEKEKSPDTLILCLISGGGSSLFVSPYKGITLEEKQKTTVLLLRSGASIDEINAVRKHISQVKGGRLAELAYPAGIISLILSDVVGDRLDVIASGPTAPDGTTYKDALSVLKKYQLMEKAPRRVLSLLNEGVRGEHSETPKRESPVFQRVQNIIVGNNLMALEAARRQAFKMGFDAEVISSEITGEAREIGKELAVKGKELKKEKRKKPLCLISGGETTVNVKGKGLGGRNMELALSFAIEIAGTGGIALLSAATDGTDGPTDSAGAFADGKSAIKGKEKGLEADDFLQRNDSYAFFTRTGDIFITGPTGTNVMDIQLLLIK